MWSYIWELRQLNLENLFAFAELGARDTGKINDAAAKLLNEATKEEMAEFKKEASVESESLGLEIGRVKSECSSGS